MANESGSVEKNSGSIHEVEDIGKGHGDDVYEGHILVEHERAVAERKLVRKLDMRLMPMIFLIYIMNYVSEYLVSIFLQRADTKGCTIDRCMPKFCPLNV